ncbi:hypothetical protein [Nocardia miyunensis]|uniref:hypothetical protein n=1 Tax=Nocardia miyunensis TaxID=282684 RepID=UPI000A69527B|nr:hypothetical protein [Nocardia miyunensis]
MAGHPRRTAFLGTLMMLVAFITGLWVHELPTTAFRVIAYVLLFLLAAVGFVLSFRDYS